MQIRHPLIIATAFGLGACGGSASGDGSVSGTSAYEDAENDEAGEPKQPDHPGPQPGSEPLVVDVEVEGSGDLSGLDATCVDGSTGRFEGLYFSEAELDDDGFYVAGLASSEAEFSTPSGCDIPDLDISGFTEVTVKAMLTSKSRNCEGYCAAKARSYAESECGAGTDSAECRAEAAGEYEASCEASCESGDTYAIVARTRLGADALATLNAQSLAGSAFGDIEVDLTFDRLEDEDGNAVPEEP